MASSKESSKTSTVETDEPDPKVPKLTASVKLEDHNTEDIHVAQADISSAEEECSTECSSCSVYKQENWQLQNRLSTSKEEIRKLKNKLKTSRDNLKSRRKEQRNWRRKGIVQANDYIRFFFFVFDGYFFKRLYAKNIFVIQGLFRFIFKKSHLKTFSSLLLSLLFEFFCKIIVENQTITLDMISTMQPK